MAWYLVKYREFYRR